MAKRAKDLINPGVRKLVRALNESGFKTCDSGDGKTHQHACDRPNAYVVITLDRADKLEAEAKRLVRWLSYRGVRCVAMNDQSKPCVQGTYDPVDGTAFLDLQFVTDDMLREVQP